MKKYALPLVIAGMLLAAGCERDPFPIEIDRLDTFWYDGDESGTRTINDELDFDIRIHTTDPDTDDQFITEWEFSYSVNGKFAGILTGDERLSSNEVNFQGTVSIYNLQFPGPGDFQEGDEIEFRFWAVDNCGTQVEEFYLFRLEE